MNNHQFTLTFPDEDWKETTVYTFEGPHDSGVQHNLVLVIDNEVEKKISLEDYARKQFGESKKMLPGFEMVNEKAVTLPSGIDAYEIVYRYNPTDELTLFQKQVFVILEGKGFVFTATFSKKTLKTIACEVDEIIGSLRIEEREE